jgi:hypothetical protein
MISAFLMGGLGNQMFQIFATIAYALENNQLFIFPYSEELIVGTKRPTYWDTLFKHLKANTTFQQTRITNDVIMRFPDINRVNQHHYSEIPFFGSSVSLKLVGYFQSHRYFQEKEQDIFSLLQIESQSKEIREKFAALFPCEKHIVSIHFRFADYVSLQHCYVLLNKTYYKNALQRVREKLLQLLKTSHATVPIQLLCFCQKEDTPRMRHIMEELGESEYITVCDEVDAEDWEQMLLMANCDSHIIANSTFSWWGAYLARLIEANCNKKSNKTVCYPSQWFGPTLRHSKMDDFFPDSWEKIFMETI